MLHAARAASGVIGQGNILRWTLWELLWHRVPEAEVVPKPKVRAPALASKLLTLPLRTQRVQAA